MRSLVRVYAEEPAFTLFCSVNWEVPFQVLFFVVVLLNGVISPLGKVLAKSSAYKMKRAGLRTVNWDGNTTSYLEQAALRTIALLSDRKERV